MVYDHKKNIQFLLHPGNSSAQGCQKIFQLIRTKGEEDADAAGAAAVAIDGFFGTGYTYWVSLGYLLGLFWPCIRTLMY